MHFRVPTHAPPCKPRVSRATPAVEPSASREQERELLVATPHRRVELTDIGSVEDAVRWWEVLMALKGALRPT
jgi:hypothetical protein